MALIGAVQLALSEQLAGWSNVILCIYKIGGKKIQIKCGHKTVFGMISVGRKKMMGYFRYTMRCEPQNIECRSVESLRSIIDI